MTQPTITNSGTHPTPADILAACADLSEFELFEAFEHKGFTPGQVAESAGRDVGKRYAGWIYNELK